MFIDSHCHLDFPDLAVNSAAPMPYLREEHEMLRDQVARFIAEEVKPHGDEIGRAHV